MSPQEEDRRSEPSDRGLRKLGAPVVVVLAFLVALGGGYLLYVKAKIDYLSSRNFRLLATMGVQVNEAVEARGKVVKNWRPDKATNPDAQPVREKREPSELEDCAPAGLAVEKSSASTFPVLAPANDGYRLRFNAGENCKSVQLKKLLDPILSRKAFDSRQAFDAVLLADDDGKVIYQPGAPEISIHQLALVLETASGQKAKAEDKSQGKALAELTGASRRFDVEVGGRKFKLFVQPAALPFRAEGVHQVWLLCGLISSDEFTSASFAVSPSYVATAVAVLLLCLLSWPLLKFKLLGESQRVRVVDMLMVALCSLLGVSLMTLLLLDLYRHLELGRIADRQTHDFAAQIASNLEQEIRRAYVQLETLEDAAVPAAGKENLLRKEPGPQCYPFLTSFALIDGEGQQQVKWSVAESVESAKVQVGERDYFKHVQTGNLWQLTDHSHFLAAPGCDAGLLNGKIGPFVLESIVSSTTGKQEAELAKPAKDQSHLPVAALAMPMLSVIHPVLPPGFEFAVIDENGLVLFHSDAERNLSENLFAETDQDRHLHSAVFARSSETMDVRYWGEDFTASLVPLRGLPWTVVALRSKGPLEAANLASVLTALILICLYVAAFALILATVVLVRPAYRAEWLWPAAERSHDYVRLGALYLLISAAFVGAIVVLPEGIRLVEAAWLLPLLALLTGYLQLTRREDGRPQSRARTSVLALLCLVLGALFLVFKAGPIVSPLLAASFLVYVRPRWWRRLTRRGDAPISLAYPTVGLLLLLLTAVLPTICFFKTAGEIQIDCLVKHGQLSLAKQIEERRADAQQRSGSTPLRANPLAVDTENLPDHPSLANATKPALDFYGGPFFHTQLTKLQDIAKSPEDPLLQMLEPFLPIYSTYSAETRELLHDEASDGAWSWADQGEQLTLVGSGLGLNLVSSPPPSWLSPAKSAISSEGAGAFTAGAGIVVDLLFLALLAALSGFISRRLFLVDLFEPLWSGRDGELPATVGGNVFLVSRRQDWRVRDPEQSFFPLHFKDLDENDPSGWQARLLDLHGSLPEHNILIRGFEHRISDAAFNDRKLAVLEDLATYRNVVVLSTMSPIRLFARQGAGAAGNEERWRALLASFTLIDADFRPRADEQTGTAKEADRLLSTLLYEECGSDPFLLQIGHELDPFAAGLGRARLLEELGERAESYYRSLWTSCSNDEKVVLGHLAEDGLVNEKSRRVVRRLMARGLVQREPIFRLMNETFRRFVLSPVCHGQVQDLEESAAMSPWDRFRRPFFGVLAAGAVFFLATQRELLDSTTAIVTAFTAGLPVLVKVADFLGSRRAAPAAK